jgi:glycosyltransferase involved in cell wall biosynthesis
MSATRDGRLTKLSVIIPLYNASKYVREAIDSVLHQKFPGEIEVIVVNDASTDDSAEIVASMPCKLINIEHSGPVIAKNIGAKEAQGELIMFHDNDDILVDGAISALYDALISNDYDAVFARREDFISPDFTGDSSKIKLGGGFGAMSGCAILKKSTFFDIGGFDESLVNGEAMLWQEKARRAGIRSGRIDMLTCRRRIHGGNFTIVYKVKSYASYASSLRKMLKLPA